MQRVKLLSVSLVCLTVLWLSMSGLLQAQDNLSLEGIAS